MSKICWDCAETTNRRAVYAWKIACECGNLNKVTVHAHCFFHSVLNDSLSCTLCDKFLDLQMNDATFKIRFSIDPQKDEEDIL